MTADESATDAKIAAAEARTDAKVAKSEARTDVKFAELSGKLDLVLVSTAKIDADLRTNRSMTVSVGFALAGLMIAIAALLATFVGLSGTMFSRGLQIRDVVKAVHAEEARQAPAKGP